MPAYSFVTEETHDFDVVDRHAIEPGSRLVGPTIIREETSTTYVDVGYRLECAAGRELMIEKGS